MTRKLAGFGLAFALAELFAVCGPPLAVWLAAAVLVCPTAAALRRHLRHLTPVRWLPLLLGALLGLAWSAGYRALFYAPAQALAGRTVHAVATVETDAEAAYETGMLRGTLLLRDVEGYPGALRVRCWAFPATEAGERLEGDFTLAALEPDRYRLGSYADGVWLQAEYAGGYAALPPSRAPRFALLRLRQALSARLRRWLPRQYGGLEAAMLLGDRTLLTDSLTNAFRAAGVSHLLAVSGLHVALLCGLLAPGGGKRRFSRLRILLRAALVLFYMALTGFPVSVLRAGMAFLLALCGDFFLQPYDLLTAMGAAAVLLGLQNAFAPCDVGFQLSFSAVLGVQLAASICRAQRRAWVLRFGEPALPARALLALAEAVQVSALAALATMPVLLLHGMTASGVAVLTNLLVVWMLRPALLLGLLVLALSLLPVLAPCMHMASFLLALWLKAMVTLVQTCAALPLARLYLPPRFTVWVLAVLALLAIVFWRTRGRRAFLWYLPAAASCVALAVCLGSLFSRDVVTIALIGTAGNPCAVITQNGQAAVLFRGGASNLAAVEEYLADHGAPRQALLVDIRQTPQPLDFAADRVLTMAQMQAGTQTLPLGSSLTLWLYTDTGGNLAVVEAGGLRAVMAAGKPEPAAPVEADVFCAGSSWPAVLEAETALTNSAHPRWLGEANGKTIYYGDEAPAVVLRPGRSISFSEVTPLAVQ